ncbi:MAG: AI-2E family transporter [Clostridia bacterium]
MQAKQRSLFKVRWQFVAGIAVAAIVIYARHFLWQAVIQLFIAMLLAMAALPMMKLLEKKLSTGLSASLAMMSLSLTLAAALLLLVPPIVRQAQQLIGMLPALYTHMEAWAQKGQSWLAENGIPINAEMKSTLFGKGEEMLSGAAPAAVAWLSTAAGSVGKWLFAPVFSFYFLRDRKKIGHWLLLWVPLGKRDVTVKLMREMRRETAGYLRGQLMVSAVVGGLTAIGLLLCGVPAWLLLGLVMGVLELIPYVGPFLGGVMVLLFSLQGGLSRTLWAMGVVILVQQLEGGMLSPQLMSDATRLHPVMVLLCVMIGGAAGGVAGILLAVPLVLCVRASFRIVGLYRSQRAQDG